MKPTGAASSANNSASTVSEIFEMLHKCNKKLVNTPLSELICEPGRFKNFSRGIDGLLLDYSRTHINRQAMDLLLKLAKASGLEQHRNRLFSGEVVNITENQPAMHMALRKRELAGQLPRDEFVAMEKAMDRMLDLAASLHEGRLPADRKCKVRDIVHIGIGGSLLGTRLLCDVFEGSSDYQSGSPVPGVHFLGSVDAHSRERLLPSLKPEETVVILVSKSFTTTDTLMHGTRVRQWLEQKLGTRAAGARMFAVTSDRERAKALGIPPEQVLYLPTWVGGRYSLWSPVSLAAAALAGPDAFQELLDGAATMDSHFMAAEPADNLPVLMGLLGVWHRNICGYASWAVIPYDQRLRLLPAHLQQLIMESNGKSVTIEGRRVSNATAPVVFGEAGTDAQHSLFQALHQGCDPIPLNMIGVIRPDHDDHDAHAELLANMLAQATALANGRSADETRRLMTQEGQERGSTAREALVSHRSFTGNRPTELLLLDDLSPRNLGMLLALYEHKVFVESVIWGINAFDQWGVELGKLLAPDIRRALEKGTETDAGLDGLIAYIKDRS